MMTCMGWAYVQASRGALAAELEWGEDERIDEELDAKDRALWADLEAWLRSVEDPWFIWQFQARLNNHRGLLQFMTSRNHRTSAVWSLLEFLARQSKGTHGLVFVHDDESESQKRSYQIWRILDGSVTGHDDPFFSPMLSPHAFGGEMTSYRKTPE